MQRQNDTSGWYLEIVRKVGLRLRRLQGPLLYLQRRPRDNSSHDGGANPPFHSTGDDTTVQMQIDNSKSSLQAELLIMTGHGHTTIMMEAVNIIQALISGKTASQIYWELHVVMLSRFTKQNNVWSISKQIETLWLRSISKIQWELDWKSDQNIHITDAFPIFMILLKYIETKSQCDIRSSSKMIASWLDDALQSAL